MKNKPVLHHYITTPLGSLDIELDISDPLKPRYQSFEFKQQPEKINSSGQPTHELLELAAMQLQQYFAGKRQEFRDLIPYLGGNGTKFQRQVWQALLDIPYGETCSYSDIANVLDNPKAVRAVGAANGKNPLAIIVPCHRVIGANGTLTGYAGGLDKKKWLLELEQQQIPLL